jgi:hypothetical protein
MAKELTVYTDDLGKFLWWDGKLLEARRTPDEEEGFIIPITITTENIVSEIDEDIIDVMK